MGKYTDDLSKRMKPMPDLPEIMQSLCRLGGEMMYRGLAIPRPNEDNYDLWLCSYELRRVPAAQPGEPYYGNTRIFVCETRVESCASIWYLRRWQQTISGLTKHRRREGPTKLKLGIWRLVADHGSQKPSGHDVADDHRNLIVRWTDDTESWCTVIPINPEVRRAGL